jgi:hypothetical protein
MACYEVNDMTRYTYVVMIKKSVSVTCFITTLPTITTLLTPKPYFSPFHLAVVSDGDSNMRFFRKFSMRRRLVMLK